MTNPVHQIQALYRTLSSTDRSKVRLFVQTYKGADSPTQKQSSKMDDWLLTGILSELARRGLVYRGNNPGGLSSNYVADSELVRRELEAQLKECLKRSPSYVELLALGKTCARALADYRSKEAPLGLKFMLNNAGKTLEAIDQSFPGYLRSGMLGCLIGAIPK